MIGVVSRPSAVTGLAAISIMAEMTFMPGRHSSSKRSQKAGVGVGLALDFECYGFGCHDGYLIPFILRCRVECPLLDFESMRFLNAM